MGEDAIRIEVAREIQSDFGVDFEAAASPESLRVAFSVACSAVSLTAFGGLAAGRLGLALSLVFFRMCSLTMVLGWAGSNAGHFALANTPDAEHHDAEHQNAGSIAGFFTRTILVPIAQKAKIGSKHFQSPRPSPLTRCEKGPHIKGLRVPGLSIGHR